MHIKEPETSFDLDSSLGFLVNRLAYTMRRTLQGVFRAHGHLVTAEEWVLLNRLWEKDGQRSSSLADAMIRDRTTVTRLLDGMNRKGLVARRSDAKDRRVVCVWLTPKGRKLRKTLVPLMKGVIRAGLAGIPAKDLERTSRTLRKVQSNLLARKGVKE